MKTQTKKRYGDDWGVVAGAKAGGAVGKRARSHARYGGQAMGKGVARGAGSGGQVAKRAGKRVQDMTIEPLMSSDDYLTQAPPSARSGVKGIPEDVAFSGVLTKYDRGGAVDIYNGDYPKTVGGKVMQDFDSAYDRVYWIACKNTADEMLRRKGFAETGSAETINTMTRDKPTDDAAAGKNRLDGLLEQSMPVLVGLDYYIGEMNANATDHYVIIVGRGQDQKGVFYQYFDPGRTTSAGHDLTKNRIYAGVGKKGEANDQMISGINGKKDYSLSEVRDMEEIE